MTERKSMGPVLRTAGSVPIEVQTDRQDFGVQMFRTPDGKDATVPASSLISFRAVACRETEDGSDIWEFRVPETQGGATITALLYWRGVDILSIKILSRVAA